MYSWSYFLYNNKELENDLDIQILLFILYITHTSLESDRLSLSSFSGHFLSSMSLLAMAAAAEARRLGTARNTLVVFISSRSSTRASRSLYLSSKKVNVCF